METIDTAIREEAGETFRTKILRKCEESVVMKQRFFL